MSGRPVIGLLAALIVEAAHWTRLRWDFTDDTCNRAWHLTSIAIVFSGAIIWLEGNPYTAMPALLSWMPALLLPVQFVQSYGLRDSVPLSSFSLIARRRKARNQRLGLLEQTTWFNFGNTFFAATMVAAAVGKNADMWIFFPGLIVLVSWMTYSFKRSSWIAFAPLVTAASILSFGGQLGLEKVSDMMGSASARRASRFNPDINATLIGTRGTVRQSPEIQWRLTTDGPPQTAPRLLRTATYSSFIGRSWLTQRIAKADFKDLDTRLVNDEPYYLLTEAENTDEITRLPSFELRGSASSESPIPLPGDAMGLRDFDLDGIESNTFGTVRIFPRNPVIHGQVFWNGGTFPESPPLGREDLRTPSDDSECLDRIVAELNLDANKPLDEKLLTLRQWFRSEFSYTRNLTITRPYRRTNSPSAITSFLTTVKKGHCEYFATSAVLILRNAGIPARYTTGYGVMEPDPKRGGFVIRGTHGHAWCRVWDQDNNRWVDFDPTPPSWFASVNSQITRTQRFYDSLKRLREDFFIWRNQPTNRLAATAVMWSIAAALTAFITRRLWKSKRRLETKSVVASYDGHRTLTPLHELESLATRHLGPRPPGQTFSRWLRRLTDILPDHKPLDEAISLHQRARFDPRPQPEHDRNRLERLAKSLAATLRRKG